MKSDDSEIILLYKALLEVAEREREELSASDIEKVEYYCSLKDGIILKIAELSKKGLASLNSEQKEIIEPILKKIIQLHDASTKAVQEMRSGFSSELTELNTAKTALKAYNAYKK